MVGRRRMTLVARVKPILAVLVLPLDYSALSHKVEPRVKALLLLLCIHYTYGMLYITQCCIVLYINDLKFAGMHNINSGHVV